MIKIGGNFKMRKLTKIIAVLLTVILVTGTLVACSGGTSTESGLETNGSEPTKMGVILTFTENAYGRTVKKYLDAIGKELNFQFQYAAAQETEEMLKALENYAAAGVKGIISMPTFNTEEEVKFCEEHGIYYAICGSAINKEDLYAKVKGNKYFAGAVGNDDAASTYGMVKVLAEKYSVKKLGLLSLPMGTSNMHDGRYAGVQKAREELNLEEYQEGLAYNLTETVQNMVAQYPELDAIIALAGGIEECMQPIITAGKQDTMKFAGFREETGAESLFETGALAVLGVGTPTNAIFAFINLHNAMNGTPLAPADGEKCNYELDTIYVSDVEDYLAYVRGAMEKNPYTIDQIKEHLVVFNPDATYDNFIALMDNYTLDYLKSNQ
jgi:ribose transport system substrate-binding protein